MARALGIDPTDYPLGAVYDYEIAAVAGCSQENISAHRRRLGISACPRVSRIDWPKWDRLLRDSRLSCNRIASMPGAPSFGSLRKRRKTKGWTGPGRYRATIAAHHEAQREARGAYCGQVWSYVRRAGERGITIAAIMEATGDTRLQVWHALERLAAGGYVRKQGGRPKTYRLIPGQGTYNAADLERRIANGVSAWAA